VQVFVDGTARGWATIELGEVRRVLVAKRMLAAGDAVAAGDMALEERPVRARQGWSFSPTVLLGAAVLRDVDTGVILGEDDVARPAPIARGAEVAVLAKRGTVVVSARGTLERPAQIGDAATVRLGDKRVVRGVLVDSETVLLGGGR
jgi:flagella basal body P-ring formation protein FlgA